MPIQSAGGGNRRGGGVLGQAKLAERPMSESDLLARITFHPQIFGGKPTVRGRRLAVEHVLGMLAAGDTAETL